MLKIDLDKVSHFFDNVCIDSFFKFVRLLHEKTEGKEKVSGLLLEYANDM
jgi:hypothetical protein